MKERVRGRIKVEVGDQKYKIELRKDGVWIRKRHERREWHLSPPQLIRLCHQQLDLFAIGRV